MRNLAESSVLSRLGISVLYVVLQLLIACSPLAKLATSIRPGRLIMDSVVFNQRHSTHDELINLNAKSFGTDFAALIARHRTPNMSMAGWRTEISSNEGA